MRCYNCKNTIKLYFIFNFDGYFNIIYKPNNKIQIPYISLSIFGIINFNTNKEYNIIKNYHFCSNKCFKLSKFNILNNLKCINSDLNITINNTNSYINFTNKIPTSHPIIINPNDGWNEFDDNDGFDDTLTSDIQPINISIIDLLELFDCNPNKLQNQISELEKIISSNICKKNNIYDDLINKINEYL